MTAAYRAICCTCTIAVGRLPFLCKLQAASGQRRVLGSRPGGDHGAHHMRSAALVTVAVVGVCMAGAGGAPATEALQQGSARGRTRAVVNPCARTKRGRLEKRSPRPAGADAPIRANRSATDQ